MLISQLSDYLRRHRRASVADAALHLDSSPDAVEAMLQLLERKQRVRRIASAAACGGCNRCGGPGSSPVFEWVASTDDR